jgi:uncharacterized protein
MTRPLAHSTPNRLAREKSPYLLQHAGNPVDWYPWGDEAFARARAEGKPIFLSIGYSTCHWCHVMEHESFENDAVAALLNQWFVPVKVDREERPDVDRIYMTAAQAMGVGGGWPLNLFLTPELEPFYGGTYFPPAPRFGRPGFDQVLASVHQAWEERRPEIEHSGRAVLEALAAPAVVEERAVERTALLEQAAAWFASAEDSSCGGFGLAPKFPSVANLVFLLRWWARDPAAHDRARRIVLRQLEAMRRGGIHDHLGGGFHRYSTDREWRVPHFEKMLYDQAQLAWIYLDAFQITGGASCAATARGIFDYVARDLSNPALGFDSAEDADTEGEEGRYYVWTPDEVGAALTPELSQVLCFVHGVTPHGNFERHTTVLHEAHTVAEAAEKFGLAEDEVQRRLTAARQALLAARSRRPRPHRDDKVIAAWNGLMISAFARGARVLDDPALAGRAVGAGTFAWEHLMGAESGVLHRRWRDGEAGFAGQLDDHAALALGFLDLYGATFDVTWLERASSLVTAMLVRFRDEHEGLLFDTPAGDGSIRVRMKDTFDGAELAGNSVATMVLVRLGRLLDRSEWLAEAERTIEAAARRLHGSPMAMPFMLAAIELGQSAPRHIVIAGAPEHDDTRALLAEVRRRFLPHDDVLLVDDGPRRQSLERLAPWVASLAPRQGRATAYVCVNHACQLPVTDPGALAAQLDAAGADSVAKENS